MRPDHISLVCGEQVTVPHSKKVGTLVRTLEKKMMWNDYYVVNIEGEEVTFKRQDTVCPFPKVGYPFTYSGYSDCYPATVIAVSKSGKQITVQDDSYFYAGREGMGGPGGEDSNTWRYEENPNGRTLVFKLNSKGVWICAGYSGTVGIRRYYHDYSF